MGIADEADRTLFVGNLDPQVTEELLFELFLQAGPLIKVKIPKDNEGKSKQFAFVNFRHDVSVPYSMNLLNGIRLFGRQLNLQFRSGSSHINQEGKSPANSQNPGLANTPNQRGGRYDRTPEQTLSSYSPPQHVQRSFSSPDSVQRQVMMNNMWQLQMQQLQQLNGAFQIGMPQQQFRGGNGSHWQQENPAHRGSRYSDHQDGGNGGGHHGREQRHSGNERHRRDFHHHDDRSGGRSRDYASGRHRDGREGRWRR